MWTKSESSRGGRKPSYSLPRVRRRELSCLITAILTAGGVTGEVAAREVPFAEPPAITTSVDEAVSVFVADVDGDGDRDALSASYLDDKIAWYENTNGDGSAWSLRTIAFVGYSAGFWSVFATDVDGDGDQDVLSASRLDDKIAWYENTNGDGTTWSLHTITTNAINARSVFAADVDGDGDADALSASSDDNKIAWYENDGSGGGWKPHPISNIAYSALSVFAADVDGDGDADALSASSDDNKIAWYENVNGDGSTWTLHTITTTAYDATSVFSLDVDGDGDLDALYASFTNDKIAWYENTIGDGTTWSLHTITTNAINARSVFAADVDGDGDADALSASSDDNKIAWYENVNGDGSSWTTHTITTTAVFTWSVFAADVDGDGDLDALSASYSEIAWYRNDTIHRSATYPTTTSIAESLDGANSIFAADLDGDGDVDGLSAAAYDGTVAWHENDGRGGIWGFQQITTTTPGAASVFAADMDGDGDMDAISGSYTDTTIAWYEKHGDSWISHILTTTAGFVESVFAADVEGDGDLDVLAASSSDNRIAWYQNDGTGGGWLMHTVSLATEGPASVFGADADGDGDMDVFSASLYDNTIAWHENDGGAGDVWNFHRISVTAELAYSVVAIDLDGDGDMDALSASADDNTIAWYENDGTSLNWTMHTISATADHAAEVFTADLDNDGDPDVLSASTDDDLVAWYENDGSAGGWTLHTLSATADGARSVFAADGDGDGDLDVLSASRLDDRIAWYRNEGGQFALPTLEVAQKVVGNGQTHDLLDIEAIHRGRMGDSDAELAALDLKFGDGTGNALTSTQADNLIDFLYIYRDDGSGIFEAGSDSLVATLRQFSLVGGVETFNVPDNHTDAQILFGNPRVYFLVADMTADAESQSPSAFQVTHLTKSSSTGEDRPHDIPLTLEFWPDTGTGVVDTTLDSTSCEAPFDLQLSNRTVTTSVACQAGTFIRAGTSFTVGSSGDLSLSAGETVRFTSGFHVDTGTLTVTIDPGLKP